MPLNCNKNPLINKENIVSKTAKKLATPFDLVTMPIHKNIRVEVKETSSKTM